MNKIRNKILNQCETLMLDMDGTVLDLSYDSHIWLKIIPEKLAEKRDIPISAAISLMNEHVIRMKNTLEWYCIDNWSELLDIDILEIHRAEKARIRYLPGAKSFLQEISNSSIRIILVSNSHRDTLNLKLNETDFGDYFEAIYISHDFFYPKENPLFWEELMKKESFKKNRTVFVDDNQSVLESASIFGIKSLIQILNPDSQRPVLKSSNFFGVKNLSFLLTQNNDD